MFKLHYRAGDATLPEGDSSEPRIIVHICNDRGGWGKGFVLALSRRYPAPEKLYREWYANRQNNDFGLGAVQFVSVSDNLYVANIIGQQGYRTQNSLPPVRYEAIRSVLQSVARFAKMLDMDASVHMPRIGCGLAGGEWETIAAIITETLGPTAIPVTVYDLGALDQ